MTPQELYDQAKNDLQVDIQKSQELSQQLNTIQQELNDTNLRVFANRQLMQKLKRVDGVETDQQVLKKYIYGVAYSFNLFN